MDVDSFSGGLPLHSWLILRNMRHLDAPLVAHCPSNLMAMHSSCDPMENHFGRMSCMIAPVVGLNDAMATKNMHIKAMSISLKMLKQYRKSLPLVDNMAMIDGSLKEALPLLSFPSATNDSIEDSLNVQQVRQAIEFHLCPLLCQLNYSHSHFCYCHSPQTNIAHCPMLAAHNQMLDRFSMDLNVPRVAIDCCIQRAD